MLKHVFSGAIGLSIAAIAYGYYYANAHPRDMRSFSYYMSMEAGRMKAKMFGSEPMDGEQARFVLDRV